MASAKRTTKVLRTPHDRTVAYARKQKPPADGGDAGSSDSELPEDASASSEADDREAAPAPSPSAASPEAAAPTDPAAAATPAPSARIEDAPPRARTETIKMPAQAPIGAPPSMPAIPARSATPTTPPAMPATSGLPKDAAPHAAEIDVHRAEDPTQMPGPREIPAGRHDDPAQPPGNVPAGDSRSMRRRTDVFEFALIYRMQTYVISRFGLVGTRGQWRVVEYPTSAAASHAYAKECSRFVSDGFSDYREWGGI
jgi:hypothetical protein